MRVPALLWAIAGFLVWSAAFAVIYGLHGIGCAYGWDEVVIGPVSLQRWVQVGAWLAFLPPLLVLALWLRRRRRQGGQWLARVGETTAWAGLAATVVTFAPTVMTSVCV